MASSGAQLCGFLLSLIGMATTLAASLMVEWEELVSLSSTRIHAGLWMKCSTTKDSFCCEYHDSLIGLEGSIHVTRSLILVSLVLSALALFFSIVGMKCTRFMDGKDKVKSRTAMSGGIMLIISGLLTIIITSWYTQAVVENFHQTQGPQRPEFGSAIFISLTGGLLTMTGGAFLSCRRCSRSEAPGSNHIKHYQPSTHANSNYV
ncbi:claudin-7-like [Cynoglossus semilaevis]|uniref:Claudin-7-like n=2 Tax=Cynoglossus semilaevis TaxID=244447 RepID=A0A3P8W4E8_CYNSE|nr:claudin-7-like [Cynoglossus semilaevis]